MGLAELVFWLWVPITLALFARLRPAMAAAISIFGARAFLPNLLSYDYPALPPLDRESIAILSCLLGCLMFAPRFANGRVPGRGVELFGVLMAVGAVGTVLTNLDAQRFGTKVLLAHSLTDVVSFAGALVIALWLPFYLGRCLVRRPADLAGVLVVVAIGGLIYSLPTLWEIRMGPFLHLDLYGYFPGQYSMTKRGGLWGWRPMVFVGHGINLTMMMLACTVAAAALAKARVAWFAGALRAAPAYLYAVLFACSSLGSFVYGTLVLPVLLFLRTRLQARLLWVVAAIVLTFPLTRAVDVFPTDAIVDTFERIDTERAASLRFRYQNEDILLERGAERAFLGWGGFGRNRIYEYDGGKAVVSDGYWVILFGQRGIVGFVSCFGLMLGPVLIAAATLARAKQNTREGLMIAAAAWICAVSALDLLPNASIYSGSLFLGGALVGAVEGWRASAGTRRPASPQPTLAGQG